MRVTASLFDSQGYEQTNVDQIAHAANLKKESLYHYCDSKSDLLVQSHSDFMDLLFPKLRRARSSDLSAEGKLRTVINDIVSLMTTHHPYVRSLFERYRETPLEDRRRITARWREYEEAVVELVKDGIADGTLRAASPYFAAMTIFGAANWSYQWFDRSGTDVKQVADAFADSLFVGLQRRPA
ncbi:TetR/AcrR family transcriptional regulator [Saccharopolyspora sp. ASAGF58]|uniref:TetR/AcrR family transcriptional regulator n=1 Tax=Saccharopolyspora sp. ASAGF58 TaxID=2719023 RepID=UPI001444C544|nr:TetR/AcrR family transcriptional regulator [Saccharopolyspora sp. ASAGF58]